jgi:fumarate hydratase class II
MPVMASNLLASIELCGRAATLLADKGISLLEVNALRMREHALRSPSLVTALAPYIGYDRAAVIAKSMVATGATIEQAGRRELGDEAWDELAPHVAPERMVYPDEGQEPSGP